MEEQGTFERSDLATGYIDSGEFCYLLHFLDAHPPVTEAFLVLYGQRTGAWWESQREHLICYFGSRASACFGDVDEPNADAHAAFDAMRRPEMYVWLVEALGEDQATVEELSRSVARAGTHHAQIDVVRELVTWDRVVELVHRRVEILRDEGKLLHAASYLVD